MATILDLHFDSDVEGFSAGTWVNTAGSAGLGEAAGALSVGASVTATKDFTNITSGISRMDIWFRTTGTSTGTTNLTSLIYILPNGGTVASGNSIATLAIDRSTTNVGVTNGNFVLTYRNTSGNFTVFPGTLMLLVRIADYYKLSVVVDHAAKTVDVYFDDLLWIRGLPWVDNTLTGFGRIAVSSQSSADAIVVDNILVTSDWTAGESVLVDHTFVGDSGEIEVNTPSTALRGPHPQPWKIAEDTSIYGGFTLGANGATPDASRKCFALQRGTPDGVMECEFKTSVSGTTYIGVITRMWDFPTSTLGGGGVFRITGTSWVLFLPDRTGTSTTVTSGTLGATLAANTTYSLKLEMRGRYYIGSYKASALDSGSYTQIFAHAAISSVTGGRGMLIEELYGPFIDSATGAADNLVRRFRFTGAISSHDYTRTVGGYTHELNIGSIKALHSNASDFASRNLFWSRGIQFGHRSSADSVGAQQSALIYDTSNCFSVRQTAHNVTEYQHLGFTDLYVTLLRRGPWVMDHIYVAATGENFAPDMDLRPELWDADFYTIENSGSATSRSDSPYHDWATYGSTGVLPRGNQSLTALASGGQTLLSQVLVPITNTSGSIWQISSKYEGQGDPISRAFAVPSGSLSTVSHYRVARAFLLEQAVAFDTARLAAWRDDVATPATLSTFVAGSLKTDASGDLNTDGFNERHGWHEITCSGGVAAFTLPVASGTRHMPAFRLHSWTSTNTGVKIASVYLTEGTDYVIDDMGGGVAVLQLLSDFTSNVVIEVTIEDPTIGRASLFNRRPQSGISFYGPRR